MKLNFNFIPPKTQIKNPSLEYMPYLASETKIYKSFIVFKVLKIIIIIIIMEITN